MEGHFVETRDLPQALDVVRNDRVHGAEDLVLGTWLLLQRLGAPVVAAPAEALEQAVFAKYEALRRSRRV